MEIFIGNGQEYLLERTDIFIRKDGNIMGTEGDIFIGQGKSGKRETEANIRRGRRDYLPIQKLEKMRPNKSSEVNSPVISLRAFWAWRKSSARSSPAAAP